MALVRWPLVDVKLVDRRRPLAVRGAQAVRASVAPTDDDHLFAGGIDRGPASKPACTRLTGTR